MAISFRHALILAAQVAATCGISICVMGQQPAPRMPAPPPMRFVSRAERSQLELAKDAKTRLRSTIKLAEDRLIRAESLTNQKAFEEASIEIGGYLGLIGYLREFIGTLDQNKGSTRDIYRHLEIAVRPHIPRLAVLRRSTPASYSAHIRDAEEYIKDTRSEALDSFYGHTVLREPPAQKTQTPDTAQESPGKTKRP
jgi:hypothetical protein